MGQIKNIKLHIVTDIKQTTRCRLNEQEVELEGSSVCLWLSLLVLSSTVRTTVAQRTCTSLLSVASKVVSTDSFLQLQEAWSVLVLRRQRRSYCQQQGRDEGFSHNWTC